jgi:aspartate/methionine/tyrosine aminotransferase
VAIAIEDAESSNYYVRLRDDYARRRDMLMGTLERAGLKPVKPQGTFFIVSDISGLGFANDVEFARFMAAEVGVACIPPSAFYSVSQEGSMLARWCFAKKNETLAAAEERLLQWRERRGNGLQP